MNDSQPNPVFQAHGYDAFHPTGVYGLCEQDQWRYYLVRRMSVWQENPANCILTISKSNLFTSTRYVHCLPPNPMLLYRHRMSHVVWCQPVITMIKGLLMRYSFKEILLRSFFISSVANTTPKCSCFSSFLLPTLVSPFLLKSPRMAINQWGTDRHHLHHRNMKNCNK